MKRRIAYSFPSASDKELLEVIVGKSQAENLICEHKTLYNVFSAGSHIKKIAAVNEIVYRIKKERSASIKQITNTRDAIKYFQFLEDKMKEEFWIMLLDTKNHVMKAECVTAGLVDSSLVHPREVFSIAVKNLASSIIIAHNHPSGDSTPSKDDLTITGKLIECGKILGIDVLDHVIIGKYSSLSLKEKGYMQ